LRYPSFKKLNPATPSSAKTKRANQAINTRHEVILRSALHRIGLRFRKNLKYLPGIPDIVFPRAKIVIFCDGDFWHGRDWYARRSKISKGSNPKYWVAKIEANMKRDREVNEQLINAGWDVIRIWETDIHSNLETIAKEIEKLVKAKIKNQIENVSLRRFKF